MKIEKQLECKAIEPWIKAIRKFRTYISDRCTIEICQKAIIMQLECYWNAIGNNWKVIEKQVVSDGNRIANSWNYISGTTSVQFLPTYDYYWHSYEDMERQYYNGSWEGQQSFLR